MRSILLFFALLFAVTAFAEVPAQIETTFANRLFEFGLFEDALFEFERIDTRGVNYIDYYIVKCNVSMGNIKEAIKQLDVIINNTSDYELLTRSALDCAALEIIIGTPYDAMSCIEKANDRGADIDEDVVRKIGFIFENEWEEIGVDPPRRRSPEIAGVLSTILPGSGQIYAGEPWLGIRSAAVNAGFWSIAVSGLSQGHYTRAITVFYEFGARYWLGGADRAAQVAEDRNAEEYLRACELAAEKIEWH